MEKFSTTDIIAIIKTVSWRIILIMFFLFLFSGIAFIAVNLIKYYDTNTPHCISVPLLQYCKNGASY